jgi:hypothetical protein
MGREARRVPLDFDWPLKKTWDGYLLPERLREQPCPNCANGSTEVSEWLMKVAYIIGGLADDARDEQRGRDMHPYLAPLREISYGHVTRRPGPQFAEFADGLAPEARGGSLGRDVYRIHRALIKAASLPDKWGECPTCDGYGSAEKYPGQRAEAEAWQPTDPPEGDGWQMWQTTSEGSPVSPVFPTAEELATWLADTQASMFGQQSASREQWLAIITGEDFAHVEIAPGVIAM